MKDMFDEAMVFAASKHKNQMRKISGLPYIVHIFDVVQILVENGASENALIAGALHDTVEDTKTNLQEIVEKFGVEIAYMVDVLTENKMMPYEYRKSLQAVKVKNASREIKMVKCADLLANMRSLNQELKDYGDIWKGFNAPKAEIGKHHKEMINSIKELHGMPMYEEVMGIYNSIFETEQLVIDSSAYEPVFPEVLAEENIQPCGFTKE